MAVDSQGNDLSAVGIPVTGATAWAPVDDKNVVTPADGNDPELDLIEAYSAYSKLGLYKTDGGAADTSETGDAITFFQDGYALAGDSTLAVAIGLAQNDTNVLEFITGQKLDANNSMLVDEGFTSEPRLIWQETMFKNRTIRRRNGVARITAVAPDKDERGTVKGRVVTLQWVSSPLFGGAKYREWMLPAPVDNPEPKEP